MKEANYWRKFATIEDEGAKLAELSVVGVHLNGSKPNVHPIIGTKARLLSSGRIGYLGRLVRPGIFCILGRAA
jgi:hypothetical protein